MRETLYFKDDDARLSFLQGNYVTLTNMSDADIERIIKYRLSPINISFQTMDSKLRCMMLNNRFAGEALKKVDRLFQAGIAMNGQIVLCKGVNDGKELGSSIRKLMGYIPVLESVSVVPVGLTKYREGLYPLEPFTPKEAGEVLDMVHGFQEEIYPKWGRHFVHASDEWYLLAGRELPPEETYDGYLQLENGVGMLRLFIDEFKEAYEGLRERLGSEGCQKQAPPIASFPCAGGGCGPALQEDPLPEDEHMGHTREISMATGKLAYPYVREMAKEMMALLPGLTIHVYEIVNYFFGEMITVAGLLTGKDIISQLTGERLGERLLLPQNMLRSGGDVFLDDVTISGMEKALQVKIGIVKSSGYDFVNAVYLQSRL